MAQYQTGDGRWLVGDVTGESNYHGFLGWRDCVIQLTGEGATEQSVHYLEALRDYALAHNPLGEPIMPPSINVWISNNGTTTAVQADDLSIDGDKFTIGGIVWDGSTWDYSDAGKASGGGSGSITINMGVDYPAATETLMSQFQAFAPTMMSDSGKLRAKRSDISYETDAGLEIANLTKKVGDYILSGRTVLVEAFGQRCEVHTSICDDSRETWEVLFDVSYYMTTPSNGIIKATINLGGGKSRSESGAFSPSYVIITGAYTTVSE